MRYIADRITIDDQICNGKPTVRGKRIAVQTILEFLSAGEDFQEILHQYPSLEEGRYFCMSKVCCRTDEPPLYYPSYRRLDG